MDNFMSKLSQKINAQDTIKANFMADMAEKEHMKKQLEEYDAILQSMRNLYLKQEENSEAFMQVADRLEAWKSAGIDGDQSAVLDEIKKYISKSDEFTHKECVKVYRNVQALLEKQDKKLEDCTKALQRSVADCKPKDLSDQFLEVDRAIAANAKSNKILLALVMVLSLTNTALILAIHFGLF